MCPPWNYKKADFYMLACCRNKVNKNHYGCYMNKLFGRKGLAENRNDHFENMVMSMITLERKNNLYSGYNLRYGCYRV